MVEEIKKFHINIVLRIINTGRHDNVGNIKIMCYGVAAMIAGQVIINVGMCLMLLPVIGITGSNGKTIVKEWLYQLLSPERIITRSPRSYNSQIGVPLSVWLMN